MVKNSLFQERKLSHKSNYNVAIKTTTNTNKKKNTVSSHPFDVEIKEWKIRKVGDRSVCRTALSICERSPKEGRRRLQMRLETM